MPVISGGLISFLLLTWSPFCQFLQFCQQTLLYYMSSHFFSFFCLRATCIFFFVSNACCAVCSLFCLFLLFCQQSLLRPAPRHYMAREIAARRESGKVGSGPHYPHSCLVCRPPPLFHNQLYRWLS